MTTQEFITSRKKHDHTFFTAWRVQTETLADIPEHMKFCRWYPEFGEKITAVRRVKVQSEMHLPEHPTQITDKTHTESYIEIETAHAIACIVDFVDGAEVGGLIIKGVRNRPCKALGTWRKHGGRRGHGMAWLRAKHGLGLCKSPESGSDICPAEAYATLAGRKWG